MQRSLSPLFYMLKHEDVPITTTRRSFNHTTYWIRTDSNNVIEKLRQIKPYKYILITKDKDQYNVIIQFITPTLIDVTKFNGNICIREAPVRSNPERLIHTLKTDYMIIEEGGEIDIKLIDKIFNIREIESCIRARSPLK